MRRSRHFSRLGQRARSVSPPMRAFPCSICRPIRLRHRFHAATAPVSSRRALSPAAINASKVAPATGTRYALRVNPSSGNLHPTEFHFATRDLKGWPDGLYHYRPSSHMAEQRALGHFDVAASITFFLTSIAWREAWKYQSRAYRYCLHDIGHAWQALALAAQAMGCTTTVRGQFPDDELAGILRVGDLNDAEWPMLIVELHGDAIPAGDPGLMQSTWFDSTVNLISSQEISYPLIDQIHAATKAVKAAQPATLAARPSGSGAFLPPPTPALRSFGDVVRNRRSALDSSSAAPWSISLPQLSTLLAATNYPLSADFCGSSFRGEFSPWYVHRVEDLASGVYRYWTASAQLEQVRSGDQRAACRRSESGERSSRATPVWHFP